MMTFPAIRIEGGLLGPDTVEQLLRGELPGQKPADFGLDGRRNLLDEIAAAFADCRKYWEAFQHRLGRLPEGDPATSVTRDAWAIPFFSLLGIEARYTPRAREVDGMSFPISHRMGEAEDAPPLHIVGARQGLDRAPASGRPRLSPHALMQEYLNRTEHLWGVVTNGLTLRLLRSSAFVRQQAYIEFDLRTMLEEQRFNDFAALYRLLHRTRFPRGVADAADCLLEQYYQLSIQQGGRVRERLREGVEEAIVQLANGFLSHPANDELRQKVAKGEGPLPAQDFYRQLLRLVYRFLFLLVAEERGLMNPNGAGGAAPDGAGAGGAPPDGTGTGGAAPDGTGDPADGTGDPAGRPYNYYGVSRLRRLCERRAAYTDDTDLWHSLRALWAVLADEKMAAILGAPPLNGKLFAPLALDNALITNRDLLGAFCHLAFYREGNAPPRPVNYAALDTEELGSVYESLLDYHPMVEADGEWRMAGGEQPMARGWRFTLAPGSERKSTGSYYTPPALVAELINSALMPVIQERLAAAERMANEMGRMANGEMAVREWRKVPKPIQERFIHDVFPRLSRSGSVGAGDVDRATGVSADAGVSTGGAVRDDQPDAPGSDLDPGQHRRGLGPALHGGIHPVSAPGEWQPGGTGDAAAPEQPGEPMSSPGHPSAAGGVTDRRQATHQPRAQPPTEKELALAWQSTPSSIRYSLFAEHALLSIKVLDPACGSGHFLLAAARRLGKELARVRTGEDEPAPARLREAIRDVIAHCIYGVDKNPLAVELARVALWLESHAPDRPLTFLDHRIKCGDSLVGVLDLAVLEAGIPDEAFEPVAGDDRKLAAGLKKRNRQERSGQLYMFNAGDALDLAPLAAAAARLAAIPDDTPDNVRRKQAAYNALLADPRRKRLKDACDLWTAAFFQRMANGEGRMANGEGRVANGRALFITSEAVNRALAGDLGNPQLVARTQAVADAQRFFHWPLEFPEVFEQRGEWGMANGEGRIANGEPSTIPHSPSTIRHSPPTAPGFDVILGNPPFMGGLKISGNFGEPYRKWLEFAYQPFGGTADLCAAFFRRAFGLLRPGGRLGLVATNTIGQGDTRESGLKVILAQGGRIPFAQRFVKWPGQASVEVNLVVLQKPPAAEAGGQPAPGVLDGRPVPVISSRLDADPEAEPARLRQNEGKSFIGSYVLGTGFTLEPHQAETLIAKDPRNADCLFPYLNGEDLNSHPEQRPSRWVINFFDWDLARARLYPDLIQIVESKVKPEREQLRDSIPTQAKRKKFWWQYGSPATQLYRAIAPLQRVLVRSLTGTRHAMVFLPKGLIYDQTIIVFGFEDDYHFALLQSSVHEAWSVKHGPTLEDRPRYVVTDCFDTFPFPPLEYERMAKGGWRLEEMPEAFQRAAEVGAAYHEHRRQIMLARGLGLTKTYNLFHDPACQDADVVRLRELHVEMDRAVLACYGWDDLAPGHGFHQNERGQTRFTVSPDARREILGRLVALNLETAKGESRWQG